MVRHGRRIKRCGTCVERKVKCDEQQPHCQRCKNAGLTCSGYHSQLKFVDEGSRFLNVACKPKAATKAVTKAATTTAQCSRPASKALTNSGKIPISQIVHLSPQRDSLFVPFTVSKLAPGNTGLDTLQATSLFYQLLMAPQSPLHHSCIQALSAMYFGRSHHDYQACQQGLRSYSQSLTQLGADISNQSTDFSTIASVLCLCLYENIVFSQPTAWLMHYDGLGRLLQAQGPRPWKTPQERALLLFSRYYITLSAGHQRRHCFLAEPQWKTERSMQEGEMPDAMTQLSDIFAQCPGIIADYDDIRKATPIDTVAKKALRGRTQALVDRLHNWFHSIPWVCSTDPTLRETTAAPLPEDKSNCIGLAVSHAMLLCLAEPCKWLQIGLTLDKKADMPTTIKYLALEIWRLASWSLRGQGTADMALMLIFPLQIAWHCLRGSEEDVCKLGGIMNAIVADSHGFELGRMRDWDPSIHGNGYHGFVT